MMQRYRYPRRVFAADYGRSAAGLALSAGPLGLVQPAPAVAWVLAAAAALFLVYFARTVCRHLTRIELNETGICTGGPLGAEIRWDSLRSMRLEYYSTRGDRGEGWMQLKLRGARRSIRIDSELEGFAEVARAAASAARRRGAGLDPATCANLGALGIGEDPARGAKRGR
jgi:hypothetical protein